ncbi:Probable CoA ligase CCL5 [Linum perenne]
MSLGQEPWRKTAAVRASNSGYDPNTGIYHSLVQLSKDAQIPTETYLDTATYVLSRFPHPDISESKIALIDSSSGQHLTYGHLRRSIVALSACLRDGLGVNKGDVVLLLSPNSILYPAICIAIMSIGAILTPANPVNTSAEIVKQATDSGAKLIISDPEQLPKLSSLLDGGIIPVMTTTSSQSETAAILYSSGTTGASKGVILTHSNFISVMTLMKWSVEAMSAKDDTFLCFIPMFHIYGLAFFALGIPAVPPVILGMVKFADQLGFDLSSLRRVGTGAAALSGELGEEFRRKFPWVELRPGYGLTESCGATTMFAEDEEAKRRPEGCGRLLPCFEAKVVDAETGEALAPYGRGELLVRSSTVMKGYLGNEKATAEAIDKEGWLKTGDLCYMDGEGVLYVVDRIKELIKHNGYQVAPAELEAILLKHPQVMDAAVIPVEDAESGEIPKAYVVRASGCEGLGEQEVIEYVGAQVAPYKKVRKVAFIKEIPKSAAGKILRKQLISLNNQLKPKL